MSYTNGRFPDSALSPIAQGRLRHDAARAWNAMNAESQRSYRLTIVPMGSMSSYRTYSQQVYLYGTSRPGWAAVPGTSNHGWAIAVDLKTRTMRTVIDRIGRKYGWAKDWSDASWEWWHMKWREGIWKPRPDPLRHLPTHMREASTRLLYHRRERAEEASTGKGKNWRKQDRWVAYWYKKVERLHRRAKDKDNKRLLKRVLDDRNGSI